MKKIGDYIIPGSILIASILVAMALILSAGGGDEIDRTAVATREALPSTPAPENIRPVTQRDNVLGDINAPIKIIEFSDFECPFCRDFHLVMHRVVENYDGTVAWVYRHFPADALHPKARKEAEASECVADLGGGEAFWRFADKIFEETPSDNKLDLALLPDFAEYAGVSRGDFEACLDSGRVSDRVQEDAVDAVNSGAQGTPYTVMVVGNGMFHVPIPGNQPYEVMEAFVERALELL